MLASHTARCLALSFFLLISLPFGGGLHAADNSAALASIDAEIAAKQGKLDEGRRLRSELVKRIPKARQSAQAMLDAEKQLVELENNARINYQNNALKVQMKLGVSIAQLGSTALQPASNLIDAAATGISLLVVDPAMNELFNWMGLGNPMEAKKKTLLSYAKGTFPSQHRLEFWLNEKPTSDEDVLARDRQIIKFAQDGIREVRDARYALMELHQELLQLKINLDYRLDQLKDEIESLKRHRAASAGENNEKEESRPELNLSQKKSTVDENYRHFDNTKLEKAIAQLNILRNEIKKKNEQIDELNSRINDNIRQLYSDGNAREKEIKDQRKKMEKAFNEVKRNPASLFSLNYYCAPQDIPYSQAIADAEAYHRGYVQIVEAYLQGLQELSSFYADAADKISNLPEIGELQTAYGDLSALIDVHNEILETWWRDLRAHDQYRRLFAPQGEVLFISVKRAYAAMLDYRDGFEQEHQRESELLEAQKRAWPNALEALHELSSACVERVRFSLEMRLEQNKQAQQLFERYFSATAELKKHLETLAGSGMLTFSDTGGIRRYNVSESWLEEQVNTTTGGSCRAIESLENQLIPAADKLLLLKENVTNARNLSMGSALDLESNRIAEQNLPALHHRVLAMQSQMSSNPDRFREAGQIFQLGGNLPWLADHLRQKQIGIFVADKTQSSVLHSLFSKQLNVARELRSLSQVLLGEAERARNRERILDTDVKGLRKAYRKLKQRYLDELACMGEEHVLSKDIAVILPKLEKAIHDLDRKPTYLDASGVIARLTSLLTEIRNLPFGEGEGYRQQIASLKDQDQQHEQWFTQHKGSLLSDQSSQIGQLLYDIGNQLRGHDEHLRDTEEISNNNRIIAFYEENFRQAYESKNESQVMSLIHDDWSAAGGVTLFDLEDNLRNMYNVFDDIQYQLSGLKISKAGKNLYNVSYTATIRGQIYENDLHHEEISTVTEQVLIVGDKIQIYKTLNGNYWSIQ